MRENEPGTQRQGMEPAEEEVLRAGAMRHRKAPLRARFARIWTVFAIGVALAASIAWIVVLCWLVVKAARLAL